MKKDIVLRNGIPCSMRKYRRARCLRITVHRDGSVALALPFFVAYRQGIEFLEGKAEWIREKIEVLAKRPEHLLFRGSAEEYQERKAEALALIGERLAHFQELYGVRWNRVSIRNQKTRWGSCSRRGDLSFNYRLIFLSSRLCDYVVVHELCHLREFNHSLRFWTLVAQAFPDYEKLRTELHLS